METTIWTFFYQNCFQNNLNNFLSAYNGIKKSKQLRTIALLYFRCNVCKHKLKRRSFSISNLFIYNKYFLMNKRRFLDVIFVTLCTSVLLNVQFKYKRK